MRAAWALAVCGLLSGCMAAVIGGGAAGGYYLGKDERPVARIADDAALTGTVKTKLVAEPAVSALDINVDTYRGIVILRGSVGDGAQRAAAERIARSTAGVQGVTNELRVRRQ
jgi:hyperosmotically inducible protein